MKTEAELKRLQTLIQQKDETISKLANDLRDSKFRNEALIRRVSEIKTDYASLFDAATTAVGGAIGTLREGYSSGKLCRSGKINKENEPDGRKDSNNQ